eukprot:2783097-Rhodomonas_salina.1
MSGVPLLWSEEEVRDLLSGTELQQHITWKRKQTAAHWRKFVKPLLDSAPEVQAVTCHKRAFARGQKAE